MLCSGSPADRPGYLLFYFILLFFTNNQATSQQANRTSCHGSGSSSSSGQVRLQVVSCAQVSWVSWSDYQAGQALQVSSSPTIKLSSSAIYSGPAAAQVSPAAAIQLQIQGPAAAAAGRQLLPGCWLLAVRPSSINYRFQPTGSASNPRPGCWLPAAAALLLCRRWRCHTGQTGCIPDQLSKSNIFILFQASQIRVVQAVVRQAAAAAARLGQVRPGCQVVKSGWLSGWSDQLAQLATLAGQVRALAVRVSRLAPASSRPVPDRH